MSNIEETTDNFKEYKDKLLFYSNLKLKEKEYNKFKNNVLSNMENLKSEDILLNDLYGERNQLLQEFKKYETILKDIQNDIFRVESIIIESKQQKEQISKQIQNIQTQELYPLKDEIDLMRSQIQLPSLPSFESEKDKITSNYLKNRLEEELLNQRIKQQQHILNQISNNNNNDQINNNNSNNIVHTGAKRGRKAKKLSLS